MDMYSHVHISILTFYSHGPIGSSMGARGSQKGLKVDPRSKESNMSSKDAQGKPTNHNTIYLHVDEIHADSRSTAIEWPTRI